ncbi:MAG: hypothetical protein CMK59_13135 [Proteobacteria bacterium]|nr:hypothetical protein [Pseudomonadota bacterium]
MVLGLLISTALAGRIEPLRKGRDSQRLIVAFFEDSSVVAEDGVELDILKDHNAAPLFARSVPELSADAKQYGVDLRRFVQITGMSSELDELWSLLAQRKDVEHLYYAFLPVPPPSDVSPQTPDFSDQQIYLGEAPDGFAIDALFGVEGVWGSGIKIADLEYSWDPFHEDLTTSPEDFAWGWDIENWTFHGNGVLGILISQDNGYGVTGIVPNASALMISPFEDEDVYTVAAAVDASGDLLSPGDVLLIEQQGYDFGLYCPVEWDPAVFEAISLLTAKGIHVVEPAGNGSFDLDDPLWDGWFDREHDSGAIFVGAGASPFSDVVPMGFVDGGSNYGSRLDLQGWYTDIVTVGGDGFADLFHPDNDHQQAYTEMFGGTSGAAAQIAGLVASANGMSLARSGAPWEPYALRSALKTATLPFPPDETHWLGERPDMRLFFALFGSY